MVEKKSLKHGLTEDLHFRHALVFREEFGSQNTGQSAVYPLVRQENVIMVQQFAFRFERLVFPADLGECEHLQTYFRSTPTGNQATRPINNCLHMSDMVTSETPVTPALRSNSLKRETPIS